MPKNQLNHWQAIQWAKQQGCDVYDLGGYLPDASEGTPVYGINQFKLGFSKKQTHFVRVFERIFSPNRYRLISWMEMMRNKVL